MWFISVLVELKGLKETQSQKAVTAYLLIEQLLPSGFVEHYL